MAADMGDSGREADAARMATVTWTIEALEDVHSIRAYIAQFNPYAAERVADRLLGAADRLADFPRLGAPIANGRRKLTTIWPYAIIYRVGDDQVFVLSVRHGARGEEL